MRHSFAPDALLVAAELGYKHHARAQHVLDLATLDRRSHWHLLRHRQRSDIPFASSPSLALDLEP